MVLETYFYDLHSHLFLDFNLLAVCVLWPQSHVYRGRRRDLFKGPPRNAFFPTRLKDNIYRPPSFRKWHVCMRLVKLVLLPHPRNITQGDSYVHLKYLYYLAKSLLDQSPTSKSDALLISSLTQRLARNLESE